MHELREYASKIDAAVDRELAIAEDIAGNGFYTEAALRIGRAVEACLYSIARELSVDLTGRGIQCLEAVRSSLRSVEINIMRKKTLNEVLGLSGVAKQLSDAIARLAEDITLRDGVKDETPRPNEQLFRELLSKVADESSARRLRSNQGTLRIIQDRRNNAAHASLDGSMREFTKEDYEDLIGQVKPFMESLLDLILGQRASAIFSQSSPVEPESLIV